MGCDLPNLMRSPSSKQLPARSTSCICEAATRICVLLVLAACGSYIVQEYRRGTYGWRQAQPRVDSLTHTANVSTHTADRDSVAGAHDTNSQGGTFDRVVVIGDLHGDLDQAKAALKLVGLVDKDGAHWVGGKSLLVQTGDVVDRGPDSLGLLRWFEDVKAQAAAAGGRVVTLLGNHEVMMAQGDTRYFNRKEMAQLVAEAGGRLTGAAVLAQMIAPGQLHGDMLRRRPVAHTASLGSEEAGSEACDLLAVHAAAMPWMIDKVNPQDAATASGHNRSAPGRVSTTGSNRTAQAEAGESAGAWMSDTQQPGSPPHMHRHLPARLARAAAYTDVWNAAVTAVMTSCTTRSCVPEGSLAAKLLGGSGVLWSRHYATAPEEQVCEGVKHVTSHLGVRRIIVGHTIIDGGRIAQRCGGALLMIDLGMSQAYGGRRGEVTVLECRRRAAPAAGEAAVTTNPTEVEESGGVPIGAGKHDSMGGIGDEGTREDEDQEPSQQAAGRVRTSEGAAGGEGGVDAGRQERQRGAWELVVHYGAARGQKPRQEVVPLVDDALAG